MFKLSKEENKLVVIAVIAAFIIILFWIFIYLPKDRAVKRLKTKVEQDKSALDMIVKIIGEQTPLEKADAIMKRQAGEFRRVVVEQKDVYLELNFLSAAADKVGVKIISTTPQTAVVFTNRQGITPKYNGESCLKVPVNMVLEGDYKRLMNYLYTLEHSPVGIYTVEGFSISKEPQISPDLKMELSVALCVFGEAK